MIMACWWGSYREREASQAQNVGVRLRVPKPTGPACAVVCRRFCVPKSDLTFLLLFCQLGERLDRFGRQIDHHRPAQDREQPGWDFERA